MTKDKKLKFKARYKPPFDYKPDRIMPLGYIGKYDVYTYHVTYEDQQNKQWIMLQGPPRTGEDIAIHNRNRPREVELHRLGPADPWKIRRVFLGSGIPVDIEQCDIYALELYTGDGNTIKLGDALDRLKV